jgi:hypothetical protein
MKEIELWSEGYAATGQHSGATYHGCFIAKDLKDAVQQFKNTIQDSYSKSLVNTEELSYWGCKFFDSEFSARKSFG